jgi:hypothetical protein
VIEFFKFRAETWLGVPTMDTCCPLFRYQIVAFIILMLASSARATDYYVDFDHGANDNTGTSTDSPWKHCPGDVNATAVPAAKVLLPGDTVFFKGGTVYRGGISATGGTPSNPVRYIGNQWGTSRAILDGSLNLSNKWVRCSSAADCFGNSNWANIWYATTPTELTNCLPQLLYNGTNWCPWAQEPNPGDPVFWEILSEWRAIQPSSISANRLKDAAVFNQSDSNFWSQAYVAIWVQGNATSILPITGYLPESNTILFNSASPPYTDRTCYYAIIGHPTHIDRPGEWVVRADERRIYLWPPDSLDPNSSEFGFGYHRNAFYLRNKRDVRITGFIAQGYYQPQGTSGYGGCFVQSTGDFPGSSGVQIENNEIRMMRSFNGAPVLILGAGTNCQASFNWVHDCVLSRGIWALGMRNGVLSENTIERINGTALYVGGSGATSSKGVMVISNRVSNVLGIHGNGLSIYQDSEDVVVSANVLYNIYTVITYENCSNLTFINNLVDCSGGDGDNKVACWGGHYGPIRWFHNTVVMNTNGHSFFVGEPRNANGVVFMTNNIIAGMYWNKAAIIKEGYNLWTALSYQQTSINVLDRQSTDRAVFVDPPQKNFNLRLDSPAKAMGVEPDALEVLTDILGASRPSGIRGDVGAFRSGSGTGSRPSAPGNLLAGPGG